MSSKKLKAPPPVDQCPDYNGTYVACNGGKSYFCETAGGGYRTPACACKHASQQACPGSYPTKSCEGVGECSFEKDPQHHIGVF